ncbi:ORF-113 [Teiidae poxvirus 1]|nr:ORF-113 [Teiidae poxvirus 1]
MTELMVTDIANEYSLTSFSEDKYPNNKNYEITNGQFTALKTVNVVLTTKADNYCYEEIANDRCTVSELDTVLSYPKDDAVQTPSLSNTYDDNKRVHLLEQEVAELRKKKSKSKNLLDFTNVLFNKNPLRTGLLNKRAIILNYASMNESPLNMDDLDACDDEEIENMYISIKQYHEIHKKKLIVTNIIAILISVIEQVLVRFGFDEIKGLSKDMSSTMIDLEIGEDCEQLANKMGIANNPILNISLFVLKIFIKRINIL